MNHIEWDVATEPNRFDLSVPATQQVVIIANDPRILTHNQVTTITVWLLANMDILLVVNEEGLNHQASIQHLCTLGLRVLTDTCELPVRAASEESHVQRSVPDSFESVIQDMDVSDFVSLMDSSRNEEHQDLSSAKKRLNQMGVDRGMSPKILTFVTGLVEGLESDDWNFDMTGDTQ